MTSSVSVSVCVLCGGWDDVTSTGYVPCAFLAVSDLEQGAGEHSRQLIKIIQLFAYMSAVVWSTTTC